MCGGCSKPLQCTLYALFLKGFGDFYDHHKPVVSEEQLEAINTYTKLLPFIAK